LNPIQSDVLQSWDESVRREWLVTNGIGGYASSTLSGAHSRRYHGLLVPAFTPPLGRAVVLSKMEEEVRVEDQLYLLSSNKYRSVVQPQGYRHLSQFSINPVPTFTYVFHEGTVVLEKRIWMAYGQNTVYLQYTLVKSPEPVKIGLLPLLAYKDYHSEQHRWDGFRGDTTISDNVVKIVAFDNANPLYLHSSERYPFTQNSGWFYNFEHFREQERGLDYTEDLFSPGRFDGTLRVGASFTLIGTVDPGTPEEPLPALERETARQNQLVVTAGIPVGEDSARASLVRAADQFLIPKSDRVSRATIIAGYHWFTDWGRDTMISLPGLCLTTGRSEVARDILESFSIAVKGGLLPNRFTDSGDGAEYNTVDASMWFVHAVYQYGLASGDWEFVTTKMLPVLTSIVSSYVNGTDYAIKVDPADGLVYAGHPGVQLTWMDAKVGDWVITPRTGKQVEINALWYNALCSTAAVAHMADKEVAAMEYGQRAAQVKASFAKAFWNDDWQCLYDYIGTDGKPDASVRPNQIFAVSLPFAPIDGARAKSVVDCVSKSLLTPYGLRTLAPGSPGYHPHYGPGNQSIRDQAYHQGTVWPWLIGPYIDAHLKVYNDKPGALKLLESLISQGLTQFGIGTLNEIFDAEEPYGPNGCIAQAWSVAEVLRVLSKLN
jgi:predicted glycogen debranching enzyme